MAGVLIRNAEALEVLAKVDTLVIDKTGTLTEGKPRLAAIKPQPGWTESELLRLAASLERGSEHPLAGAIVAAAEERSAHSLRGQGFPLGHRPRRYGHCGWQGRGARKRRSSRSLAIAPGNLAARG